MNERQLGSRPVPLVIVEMLFVDMAVHTSINITVMATTTSRIKLAAEVVKNLFVVAQLITITVETSTVATQPTLNSDENSPL